MKIKSLLTTTLLSGAICLVALLVYHKFYTSKNAYIEIKKVFNGFQMKAELEEKYKRTEKSRARLLDSLSFNLKVLAKHLNDQKEKKADINKDEIYQFEYSRDEFVKLKNQYQEDNAALSRKFDEQILTQLTQYVIEFGKEHNYEIIFGADGNGNLMYSKEKNDISDEIIVFINNKYKGID